MMNDPFGFSLDDENILFYFQLWLGLEASLPNLSDGEDEQEQEYGFEELDPPNLELLEDVRERLIAQLESALVTDGGLKWYIMTLHKAIPDLCLPGIVPPADIVEDIMKDGLKVLSDFDLIRACFCPSIVAHIQIEIWRRATPYWLDLYEFERAYIEATTNTHDN